MIGPVACSGATIATTIDIQGFAFNPDPVQVTVGAVVQFTNLDAAIHTTTSGNPGDADAGTLWNSGSLGQGDSYCVQFGLIGSFNYFCMPHQGFMNGYTITVMP